MDSITIIFAFSLLLAAKTMFLPQASGAESKERFTMSSNALVETKRLEKLQKKNHCDSSCYQELSEIYFLTSRCSDLKQLYAESPTSKQGMVDPLLCACDPNCHGTSGKSGSSDDFSKVKKFESALASSHSWSDPEVQAAWKAAKHIPEAKYRAMKFLQTSKGPLPEKIQVLRTELETSIAGLAVGHH